MFCNTAKEVIENEIRTSNNTNNINSWPKEENKKKEIPDCFIEGEA